MVNTGHPVFDVTDGQYQIVYDFLSLTFAAMAASTLFFWLRLPDIHEKYKTALVITGMVTFIAAYHYLRIFQSWVEAFEYPKAVDHNGSLYIGDPHVTGTPFNDAYRYMDWLLTVPLLLIEIILVMNLSDEETSQKSFSLGSAAALMIILGYPGELMLEESQHGTRWLFWAMAMIPFCYIVYTLLIGLKVATNSEQDMAIRSKIKTAQWMTVLSWLTYPIVFILPMLGLKGADAVVGIQIGYCISDVIAKCGVGFVIYNITVAKSARLSKDGLLQ